MKGGDGETEETQIWRSEASQRGTGMVKVERQRWDRKESGREMGSLQPPGSVSRVRQEQQGKPEVGVPANRESSGHSGHSVGPELEPNR